MGVHSTALEQGDAGKAQLRASVVASGGAGLRAYLGGAQPCYARIHRHADPAHALWSAWPEAGD